MVDETIPSVLARAKEFKKPPHRPGELIRLDPMTADSPTVQIVLKDLLAMGASREEAEDSIMRGKNLGEILTPEELAERLKVSVTWVMEKRRPQCPNPIPALPLGRLIRTLRSSFLHHNVRIRYPHCRSAG